MLLVVIGIAPTILVTSALLRYYESRAVAAQTSEVQTQLRVLANHLITYGYLNDQSSQIVAAELAQFSSTYDGRVIAIDSSLRVVEDTYGMANGKTMVSSDVIRCLRRGSRASTSRYDTEDSYIEVVLPISETASLENEDYAGSRGGDEKVYGVMLASVSTASMEATLDVLERRAMLLVLILGLIIFGVSMVVSSALVQPFERLSKKIGDVKSGFSDEPISANEYLETQHIVTAFNQVLGRMRALDESRKDFVSNVSHELKTPMTSMKVLADSLLADPNTPPEMYREFLQDIDSELDRENKVIAELLNLAKMDRKQVTMNIKQVNINELLEIVMKRVRPLAQKRDIELTLVAEREVTAEIDEVKITMVFTNLIENAVKYNKEHGKVVVTINADRKNFILTVEDNGVGIPAESQGRIFERFYRVDKSRSREIGGTGLGLSITKSAVLLHRGTITLESEENVGTKFVVTIPLIYITEKNTNVQRALVVNREQE